MNIKKFFESYITQVATSSLEKFSDVHKGETCYIFGDGPSIKWFDLSLFDDHPAICCGMIPFHKDFSKLDVRYVSVTGARKFVPRIIQPKVHRDMQVINDEYKKLIKRFSDREFFVSLSNRLSLRGKNINYVFRGLPKIRRTTDQLLSQFDLFSGAFYSVLTLAYYFGFKKVYLIGFDGWTLQPARAGHWYEIGEGPFFEPTNFAVEFLEIINREIDIHTISVEGAAKNVNGISYCEFTGNSPVFKENHEICDDYYLKMFATYGAFDIFPRVIG